MPEDAAPVTVNGEPRRWSPALTVAQLLDERGIDADRVATAVNGEFVARGARARTTLQPGDALAVFQPIVGG